MYQVGQNGDDLAVTAAVRSGTTPDQQTGARGNLFPHAPPANNALSTNFPPESSDAEIFVNVAQRVRVPTGLPFLHAVAAGWGCVGSSHVRSSCACVCVGRVLSSAVSQKTAATQTRVMMDACLSDHRPTRPPSPPSFSPMQRHFFFPPL